MPRQTADGVTYPAPSDLHPSSAWWESHALTEQAARQAVKALVQGSRPAAVSVSDAGKLSFTLTDGSVIAATGLAYAPAGEVPNAPERLKTLRDFKTGRARVAIVGDSTGNADNEWARMVSRRFGAQLDAGVRREYRTWNATSSAWNQPVVDEYGPEQDLGVIVTDTFTRTGQVSGSQPDTGPAWQSPILPAAWTADGSKATCATSGAPLSQNMQMPDATVEMNLSVVTSIGGGSMRAYIGSYDGGLGNGVWLSMAINSIGGLTIQLWKTIQGSSATSIAASAAVAGVVANSATPQAVRVVFDLDGVTATATADAAGQSTTTTGSIASADYATLGDWTGFIRIPGSATWGFFLDTVNIKTPKADAQDGIPVFDVWNGSIPGATLATFTTQLRESMFPAVTGFDVLILNVGHNYGAATGPTFTAAVKAWIAEWKLSHPEAAIWVMSQNPQVPPALGADAHRDRHRDLRLWASDNGFVYSPIYEAFTARPDGGLSLVEYDGVHPTTPPISTQLDGDYGSVLWADVVMGELS